MTNTTEAAPATFHRYTFEAWPPGATALTLPALITVTAPDAEAARPVALVRCPAGWLLILTGHHRSHCFPAHPGRD